MFQVLRSLVGPPKEAYPPAFLQFVRRQNRPGLHFGPPPGADPAALEPVPPFSNRKEVAPFHVLHDDNRQLASFPRLFPAGEAGTVSDGLMCGKLADSTPTSGRSGGPGWWEVSGIAAPNQKKVPRDREPAATARTSSELSIRVHACLCRCCLRPGKAPPNGLDCPQMVTQQLRESQGRLRQAPSNRSGNGGEQGERDHDIGQISTPPEVHQKKKKEKKKKKKRRA